MKWGLNEVRICDRIIGSQLECAAGLPDEAELPDLVSDADVLEEVVD